MEYIIDVNDYELDDEGIVIDRAGDALHFNDADDFVMMWNYFKRFVPKEDITEDITEYGNFLIMPDRRNGNYITEYQVTGESYELIKEQEAKEKEWQDRMLKEMEERIKNNRNNDLPF
jgi:hypothetical protein